MSASADIRGPQRVRCADDLIVGLARPITHIEGMIDSLDNPPKARRKTSDREAR